MDKQTEKDLIEKRGKLVVESRKFYEDNKTSWTKEHQARFDGMHGEIAQIKTDLDAAVQQRADLAKNEAALAAEERLLSESRGRQTGTVVAEGVGHPSQREADLAFRAWAMGKQASPEMLEAAQRCGVNVGRAYIDMAVRTTWGAKGKEVRFFPINTSANGDIDKRSLAEAETRDLSVGTTTLGGNMVPNEMMQRYSDIQKWFGRVGDLATVINTETGATLPWPAVDDTGSTGTTKSEGTSASAADPTINVINLGAFTLSSKRVPVSWELIQDSFVNVNSLLGMLLGRRIARFKNTKFTAGAGTTEPKGLITGAATTTVAGGATTTFSADDVITLIHAVDKAYRNLPDAGFMAHDTVIAFIRKMKDGQGRYLWEPSVQSGQPDRIYGYPIEANNDMDSAFTTGKKLVGFGSIGTALVVRYAGATRFIRDESILVQQHQTYFEAWERGDSNVVDSTAFKVLALN
jgi:HK97 family phage major capsid protein